MSADKLARYDLIPPAALELVAEAFGRGAAKHDDDTGWGDRPADESYASLMRHLQAHRRGERADPEDGQHHLAAVIVNALILMDNEEIPVRRRSCCGEPFNRPHYGTCNQD